MFKEDELEKNADALESWPHWDLIETDGDSLG